MEPSAARCAGAADGKSAHGFGRGRTHRRLGQRPDQTQVGPPDHPASASASGVPTTLSVLPGLPIAPGGTPTSGVPLDQVLGVAGAISLTLDGGDGDDVLIGGPGQDVLDGGTGNNIVIQD